MKNMTTLIVAISFSLLSTTAFAKSSGEIFTASSNSNLIFSQRNYENYKASFNATVGYDHAFSNGFELGGTFGLSVISHYSIYALTVGPTYNIQGKDIENSYYAGFKIGMQVENTYGYTYDNAIAIVEGGKRFKIIEGITYSPGVTITQVFGANADDPTIAINIFKFSLVF